MRTNTNGAMKMKQSKWVSSYRFIFVVRQKIAFLGKVQVCQLHLCLYRFDLEDERPDDEISSFFLLF